MSTSAIPNDGPIYLEDLQPSAPPPTLDQLRADGDMLVDDVFQKFAVYVGCGGAVVLMSQADDEAPQYTPIDHDMVPKLVAALQAAQVIAAADWALTEAEMSAHEEVGK